jgi:glycosyltransferase involved in cell wall biosynthesis
MDSDNVELRSLIDKVGARTLIDDGRVQLRGSVHDLAPVMAETSALVISSLYGETAPLVGVEALSHGVPVITSRLGLTPLYADPRFVVDAGSAVDLAQAMASYCELDNAARSLLSEDARNRCATQFSIDRTTADLDAEYRRAIDRRARVGRSEQN